MCPMRIFVFLFSLILLMYFSAKWAVSDIRKVEEDPVQSQQSKWRKFVSMFTGEYIYRKLKWEWRTCDGDGCVKAE